MASRSGVSGYEQLAGNIDDAEEASQPVYEIHVYEIQQAPTLAVLLVEFTCSLLCS